MSVRLVPEGSNVVYLGDSNDVRGRVVMEVVFNKVWVSELK